MMQTELLDTKLQQTVGSGTVCVCVCVCRMPATNCRISFQKGKKKKHRPVNTFIQSSFIVRETIVSHFQQENEILLPVI